MATKKLNIETMTINGQEIGLVSGTIYLTAAGLRSWRASIRIGTPGLALDLVDAVLQIVATTPEGEARGSAIAEKITEGTSGTTAELVGTGRLEGVQYP